MPGWSGQVISKRAVVSGSVVMVHVSAAIAGGAFYTGCNRAWRCATFIQALTIALSLAASSGNHGPLARSEEHTSELQSLMRISYAVFCLKKKKQHNRKQV